MDSKKQTLLAVLSMAGMVALWAILTDAWGYSDFLFPERFLVSGKYFYGYFSRIIWLLPILVLILRFEANLFWNRKELFSKPKFEPVFIIFMSLTTVYALTAMWINHHTWHITDKSLIYLTVKFMIVGIAEETVFRGWGYNLLKKSCSDTAALVLSVLMFVVLHWPAYFIKLFLFDQLSWLEFLAQSISAAVCGLLFTVMLKRSKTLFNPIIAHFYYDLMLEIFA